MLGQEYFFNRLGDIYEYSIIPYKCGNGTSNQGIDYFWELCVDVSGNVIFVMHTNNSLQHLVNFSKINSFYGICSDEVWEITCTDIHILSKNVEMPQEITCFCLPSTVVLEQKEQGANSLTVARAYFSNFDFSRVDYERGFFVEIDGKNLCFQMANNSKKFMTLLDIGRINNAILSTVSIPINSGETINAIETEVKSISWFF